MAVKKVASKTTTRVQIIEHAINLFVAKGFENMTFSDVAKKCKISQPAIYNHFENKMDLLKACALYAAEKGRQYIDQESNAYMSAPEKLKKYLEANVKWFATRKNEGFAMMALYYFASSNPELRQLYDLILLGSLDRMKVVLAQGQRENAWKIQDMDFVARMLHSLLVGELYKTVYMRPDDDVSLITERLWKAFGSLAN